MKNLNKLLTINVEQFVCVHHRVRSSLTFLSFLSSICFGSTAFIKSVNESSDVEVKKYFISEPSHRRFPYFKFYFCLKFETEPFKKIRDAILLKYTSSNVSSLIKKNEIIEQE